MDLLNNNLLNLIRSLIRNRFVLQQLTRAEILTRYRGSVLGLVWSIFNPLLMLAVYSVVFGFLLKARWAVDTVSEVPFALQLFTGIVVHAFFADCLIQSTSAISKNANFVKKIVFPLELLPVVTVAAALFNLLLGFIILLGAVLLFGNGLYPSILLTPVIILPFVFFVLGMSFILSAIGVYIRDISQVAGLLSTVFLFLSPILYPLSILPEKIQTIAMLNPLSLIIEQLRAVILYGEMLDWVGYVIYFFAALLFLMVGYGIFRRTRGGFADVI